MKATSHAMEDYIFTKVVLPLKGIRLQAFETAPPVEGFGLRVDLDDEYLNSHAARFNYQRDMLRRKAPKVLIMETPSRYMTVGRFYQDKKRLELYTKEVEQEGFGYVLSKIHSMFYNYPQYSVEMKESRHAKRRI